MVFASSIFIDNTGNTILAVNSWFASSASDGQAIGSIFTIQANRSILAVDDDGRTIFTVNTDFTIFAVSTFFADSNIITKFYIVIISMGSRILGPCQDKIATFDFLTIFLSFPATNADRRMSGCYIFHFIQLVYINSVSTIFTRSHIDNSLTSCINMRLSDGWPILDGEARVIDGRIAYHDRPALGQVDILSQLDFQLAADVINANVLVCQFLGISSADDIELFVQLLRDNRIIIAFELQTFTKYFRILGSHISNSIKLTAINSIRTS